MDRIRATEDDLAVTRARAKLATAVLTHMTNKIWGASHIFAKFYCSGELFGLILAHRERLERLDGRHNVLTWRAMKRFLRRPEQRL